MKFNIFNLIIGGALLLIIIFTIAWFITPAPESFRYNRTPVLIAHAGGAIDGKTYTNAKEAVELAINNGYCFIELDLEITKDQHIAALHFWRQLHSRTGVKSDTIPLSAADFETRRIQGRLHPLLADDINKLFSDTSLYLVTDIIQDYDLINQEIAIDRNKLPVEVFSYKSYCEALQKGIKYPMLSVATPLRLLIYSPLLITKKVKIITIPVEIIATHEKELKFLHEYGITIFAFTTNDKDFILKHIGKTVSGFYTDSVKPADISLK
ncbi:MAG: hypothetical protein LBR34_06645 [Prevotella sp.]|jgi:glycerophosphoryl diester phosphodiesterase|nr:hypothetical protein [Prevotella sp.]